MTTGNCFVDTVSKYKCELTESDRMHQTSANQSKTKCQQREGSWTHNLTPNHAAMGNFQLLGEGDSVFSKTIDTGQLTIPAKGQHPRVFGHQKLVLMGLENKVMDLCGQESETDLGRAGEDGECDQTTLYGTLKNIPAAAAGCAAVCVLCAAT